MYAVIQAGGAGTRLKTITGDLPKVMVEICGKPILEWQLERSNGGWDFWYHKAQEYKEKINTETEEETDSSNDDEILDAIE